MKEGEEPDVVIAAAGTEPNLEALAGISILHKQFPELKIRFINVVDILKLRSPKVDLVVYLMKNLINYLLLTNQLYSASTVMKV